jgi:quinohemoprotein ethanol dehydrogenase
MYFPASLNGSSVFAVNRDFVPKPGLPPVVRVGVNTGGGANATEPPAIGPTSVPGQRGALVAWDPVNQKERWRADGGGGGGGGVLSTASNLVFQVRGDGHLLAYRADDGMKLAEIETGLGGGMGPPITFDIDGTQYVGVLGNPGGGQRGAPAESPQPPKLVVFAVK